MNYKVAIYLFGDNLLWRYTKYNLQKICKNHDVFLCTYNKWTPKTLNIKNNGTRNILLREGIQCLPGITDENECDHISGKRLYPGNSWSVELPHDLPVKYYLTTGTQNSVMEFD